MNGDSRLTVQYSRVSTDYQSVESQQTALESMAKDSGGKVTRLEETVSGRKMVGEQLQYLRHLVESSKVKEIHVYHVDRLGRNVLEGLKFVDVCRSNGCRIRSHCQPWDFDSPEGRMMLIQMLSMAEYFLGNLSRGTAAGLARAKARGTFKGGTSGRWMRQKTAARVKKILALADSGVTRRDIARILEMDERTVARVVNERANLPKVRERVWDAK